MHNIVYVKNELFRIKYQKITFYPSYNKRGGYSCFITMQINIKTEKKMKKQFYIPPRISFYEVETTAILAGSGESSQKPVGSPSLSVSDDVTCGDKEDVWE